MSIKRVLGAAAEEYASETWFSNLDTCPKSPSTTPGGDGISELEPSSNNAD